MNDISLIQFFFLFGLSIVFSTISLQRQTMISFLLAGILWITTGLTNFILNPTEMLSTALSYILVMLGVIFLLASIKVLGDAMMERKEQRWSVSL